MKKALRLSAVLMLALGIFLFPMIGHAATNPDFTAEAMLEDALFWSDVDDLGEDLYVKPGSTIELRGLKNYWSNEVVENVKWTSSDLNVAVIESVKKDRVVIKGKKMGETIITATDPDGNTCKFSLYVDVQEVTNDGVRWYITSERTKTASLYNLSDSEEWDGVIPEAITYKGKTYTVTKIQLPADEENVKEVETIQIPATVTSIKCDDDWMPFGYVKGLKAINVEKGNPNYYSIDGVLFDYYTNETGTYKRLHTYPYDKVKQCYQIPEGTQLINDYVFYDATPVKELVIPKSLDLTKYDFYGLYERDDDYNIVKWNIKLWINSENKDAIDCAETWFDIPIPWEKWENDLGGKVTLNSLKVQLSEKYNTLQVKWSASKISGATMKYQVEMKTGSGKWKAIETGTKKTSLKKTKLKAGTKYTFRVTPYAVKDGKSYYGKSKTSSAVYIMKKVNKPTIKKSSKGKVKITWKNINGETGYQISKSTKKSKTNIVATMKGSSAKSKIIKATKGKTYYYKVRAYKTVNGKKIYGPWSEVKSYKLK